MTPVGFAIVGVGMVAECHAQAIAAAQGARLVGVAGRSPDKVRAFANKHRAPFFTTCVEELVRRPEVNVVCVATPSGAHLEPALAAIRAGKHLVVEKPIEITLERAQTILSAAEDARVLVAAMLQARFGEGARTVKAAIDAGRFGRFVLGSAYVKWQRTAEYYKESWHGTQALDGGGALMNQGIHAIDLLQWFAGMPSEVFGWSARRVHQGIEMEDTASATLRFPHGALGVIEATTAVFPGWQRRIEICGEHGSASLLDDHIARWDFRDERPEDAAIREVAPDERLRSGASGVGTISHHGHLHQIQNVIDSLQSGNALEVNGRSALNALRLIHAIYASAASGLPVRLD